MNAHTTLRVVAVVAALLVGVPAAAYAQTPADPEAMRTAVEQSTSTTQPRPDLEPTAAPTAAPAPVPLPSTFVDFTAATRWYYRTLDPRTLLRAMLGSQRAYELLAPKISRESSWNCGVNNRRSSAAGLGQTLHTRHRVNLLAQHELGPFTWAEVRGPDCLADVALIVRLYAACGLGDWTPPYRCLTPRY